MPSQTAVESATARIEYDPVYPCAIIHLSGNLDESAAPHFRTVLHSAIERGHRDLALDMSDLTGITSVGISAFLCGLKRFGSERGRIVIVGCADQAARVLRTAGIDRIIPLFPDLTRALADMFTLETQAFEPVLENSARLRPWIRSVTASMDLLPSEREGVEAAASEAFTNAVEHASPRKGDVISVRIFLGSAITVEVQDQGPGFEARQYFAADPTLLHTGARGLGIYVMRNLMDHVEFIAGESTVPQAPPGTTVRLTKRLERREPEARCRKQSSRPAREPGGG